MRFSTATAILSVALLATTAHPSEAFANPSFGLSSSRRVANNNVHDTMFSSRGGDSTTSSSSMAMSSTAETANEVVTISTAPIEGMKPGTSGLRKKVSNINIM